MRFKLTMLLFGALLVMGHASYGQTCLGFTTDAVVFDNVPAVDLLPAHGWNDPQPVVRGDVEYTGQTMMIGTECAGAYGTLAMCDFSGPVTGVPVIGSILQSFGVDYWADTGINPFQLEIELASGAIETFTSTTNGGFVGYCAPPGDPIVRLEMVGHDGVATAFYHADPSLVPVDVAPWGSLKAMYK